MNFKFISDIAKIIEHPWILSLLVFLIMFMWIFRKGISSKLFPQKPNKASKVKIKNLENHNVFTTLEQIKSEVSHMKFYTHKEYDSTKTKMCEHFTIVKSNICSKWMHNFLNYEGIETMERDKLKKVILELQTNMHQEYIREIREIWIARKIKAQDVDYIINLFEKFRYDVVKSFENRIDSIFGSTNYQTNYYLILAVFEMWAMGIDLLPRDMQTTFENLNGKFKDIKYER
jgi:hypothetical protein